MATAKAGIEVRGSKELRRTMKRAGEDLSELKDAHMGAARMVVGLALPNAPRRTGRLAASVRPGASNTAATIRAGGARLPYAAAIHWGWPRRGISAQPWLSQTAQQSEPAWVPIYTRAVDKILARVEGI